MMLRVFCSVVIGILLSGCGASSVPESDTFAQFFTDDAIFEQAMKHSGVAPLSQNITGVTLPHHLLASDLIADAFRQISQQTYDRIMIISPDHFDRGETVFSTTTKNFTTMFGEVLTDSDMTTTLLTESLISDSELFSHEHGVRVFLPFIKTYFPDTPVVQLAIKISATPDEWQMLVEVLKKNITPDTLILQSTDFSHYLDVKNADIHDQQTLRAIASRDVKLIEALDEPDHLDSRGAQFVQSALQQDFFSARPVIVENKNSQFYSEDKVAETTSYIVQLYSPETLDFAGEKYFFAGDTFFGRSIFQKFSDPDKREQLIQKILEITGGSQMIINLEGVIRETCGEPRHDYELCMSANFVFPVLKELNVVAVSLANNHRYDFGEEGHQDMKELLEKHSITVLEPSRVYDFPEFKIAAVTDLDNFGIPSFQPILQDSDFDFIEQSEKPFFMFIHWGAEFIDTFTEREEHLSQMLREKNVELIIGAHSHRASKLDCQLDFCQIFSLGNFIFDQPWDYTSGAILEVDFFENGNYFPILHALPNFYTET